MVTIEASTLTVMRERTSSPCPGNGAEEERLASDDACMAQLPDGADAGKKSHE